MKKLSFLLIAALLLGVVACQKDGPKKSDELTVEPTLTFEGNGGRLEVAVASDYEWQFEENADWLTIEPFLDRTGFYATAVPHGEDTERTATITLTNGKTEQKIAVTQGVVGWYDFVQSRVTLENPAESLLPGSAKDNDLAFQQFYFYGAKTNAALLPEEDSYRFAVATVTTWPTGIDEEGTTITAIDIPTGTYEYTLGGENAHEALPSINGTDNGNNYTIWVKKDGTSPEGYNDFGEGSEMVIEKTGDQYSMTCYLVSKADGTIFKGRYTGKIVMDNPYNTGLSEDMDFGTINGAPDGSMVGGTPGMKGMEAYGIYVSFSFRVVGEGLSREKGMAPHEGSGYYLVGAAAMGSSNGYVMPNGTYPIRSALSMSVEGFDEGLVSDASNAPGLWIYRYENGVVVEKASLISGTVKVTCNDNKTDESASISTPTSYTWEIDAVERLGHKVKGTITFESYWQDLMTDSVQ